MINDKKLFEIMIKYHPIFVGWLIQKKLVIKEEDRLVLFSDANNREITNISTRSICKPLEVYEDGVKRIGPGDKENYIRISLTDDSGYRKIIESGIDIFDIGNWHERYCHISHFINLVNSFPDTLLDTWIPDDFPRFEGKTRDNYMLILENQVEFIKKNNYKLRDCYNYRFYYSILGNYEGHWEVFEDIKRYGIFSNTDIYKRIEWDFDLVEKYKDQIMWRELINESNLIWEEETIVKYEKYIPFCNANADIYCEKFKEEIDYKKFGKLSNNFLERHKDDLDWKKVFETCRFDWNGDELKHFCQYALSIDMPYSKPFSGSTAASQIRWSIVRLIDNTNFTWTKDNLMAYLNVDEYCWEELTNKHRPDIFRLFLSIENIRDIALPHIKNIDNFWEIINNPNNFPYDELTSKFTIENIHQHMYEWSEPLRDSFLTMHRTPDTNYYYYYVETQWDIFSKRNNIPLTYELAKYLAGIEIKIGGTYIEADDGTIEEDQRFPVFNGLQLFSHHHIASHKDILLCIEDGKVADVMLANNNSDLVNAIMELFFKDYAIKDYIEIINRQKDWDVIDVFSDDEI